MPDKISPVLTPSESLLGDAMPIQSMKAAIKGNVTRSRNLVSVSIGRNKLRRQSYPNLLPFVSIHLNAGKAQTTLMTPIPIDAPRARRLVLAVFKRRSVAFFRNGFAIISLEYLQWLSQWIAIIELGPFNLHK
jgi:hypothetical protein